jgi:hypothetical protein
MPTHARLLTDLMNFPRSPSDTTVAIEQYYECPETAVNGMLRGPSFRIVGAALRAMWGELPGVGVSIPVPIQPVKVVT